MYWSVCDLLTDRNGSCDFTQCGDGRCCCSTVIKPVWGEIINVVVWRGGKRVASKVFSIERSSKSTSLKLIVIYNVSKHYTKPWSVNIKEIWWNTLDFFFCPSSLTVKPRVPKIHSVQQSNMNFQVKWRSNMETAEMVDHYLEAVVTYYKKGHTKMVGAVRWWTRCHERCARFCHLTSYY